MVLKRDNFQIHQERLFELSPIHFVYRLAAEFSILLVAIIRNGPCLKDFETVFAVRGRDDLLRRVYFLGNMLRELVY